MASVCIQGRFDQRASLSVLSQVYVEWPVSRRFQLPDDCRLLDSADWDGAGQHEQGESAGEWHDMLRRAHTLAVTVQLSSYRYRRSDIIAVQS